MPSVLTRLLLLPVTLLFAASAVAAGPGAPQELQDLYFGEALYYAWQDDWFAAIARLDAELGQFRRLDEPELDSLFRHLGQAEFAVGDFELAYRMHQRAGRAITAVIDGNVEEPVRNEAIFRLARLYFQKDQPAEALQAIERIAGAIPAAIRDELPFLRAQILMANGRFAEAATLLGGLQGVRSLTGFAAYNLGIALIRDGREAEGRFHLDRAGQIESEEPAALALRDKANLVLGDKLLTDQDHDGAKQVLDRVRLNGPFSGRALLGSGWADAASGRFERALVPWSLLVDREVTDAAVQEGLLALPYAYGKLNVHGRAALLYGRALEAFAGEIAKLDASTNSIRAGRFLQALVREELRQDSSWVVKLRSLPETPETYYLLELMASHDFQESLKNYLDLEELRKKLLTWEGDLDAFAELIERRRAYYRPLLPAIDEQFRRLDAQLNLRLEQRERIGRRLQAMLTAARPEYLLTAEERILREQLAAIEERLSAAGGTVPAAVESRLRRLQGVLHWTIQTSYDQRLTEAHRHLQELDGEIERLQAQYTAFVRSRQAALHSCEGYDDTLGRQRLLLQAAQDQVRALMARQGEMLEVMAANELARRRERLEEFQLKARFALADSYDRATRAQVGKGGGQ